MLNCLRVCGTVLCPDTDTTVVYGTGVFCVDGKVIETNIPVGQVRGLRGGLYFEDFIKNQVQLRLCESSIVWEQILSHFKSRKQTTDAHMACFKNVGLELLHTKHDTTAVSPFISDEFRPPWPDQKGGGRCGISRREANVA